MNTFDQAVALQKEGKPDKALALLMHIPRGQRSTQLTIQDGYKEALPLFIDPSHPIAEEARQAVMELNRERNVQVATTIFQVLFKVVWEIVKAVAFVFVEIIKAVFRSY